MSFIERISFPRCIRQIPQCVQDKDEKETLISPNSEELTADGGTLVKCTIDLDQIEKGARAIELSKGIVSVSESAFDEYNNGEFAAYMGRILRSPEQYRTEIEKELQARSLRYQFPPEVRSMSDKLDYLMNRISRMRLCTLNLPASLKHVGENAFPVFLERIEVDENNSDFRSVDGVLFSRDMKKLVRFPGVLEKGKYSVPEGVEELLPGALSNCVLDELTLPSTLRTIGSRSFANAQINKLAISDGVKEIQEETFTGSKIKYISLPATIRTIKDYAFKGISGLKSLSCPAPEITMGTGLFSGGTFDNISWWCWSNVPEATFINCNIKDLTVPSGVANIRRYAFAGCYRAEKITIPDTVKLIEPHAFDEGSSFRSPVTLPKHLLRYIFRFPAQSPVNNSSKFDLVESKEDFDEEYDVLAGQKKDLERELKNLSMIHAARKRILEKQIHTLEKMMESI